MTNLYPAKRRLMKGASIMAFVAGALTAGA
jgi:hypothetical protein